MSDEAQARRVTVSEDGLTVDLVDGRTITTPLKWFPRLLHGTAAERSDWRLMTGGEGIHWPALDEDISVASLPGARPSIARQGDRPVRPPAVRFFVRPFLQ